MTTPRNFWAHAIAGLGGVIVLVELFRHWRTGHAMEGSVIGVGCLFGFIGAYMADRKGALEGGGFIVDATTRIIAVVRSGRRSTDSIVVQKAAPSPPATPPAPVPDLTQIPAGEKGP